MTATKPMRLVAAALTVATIFGASSCGRIGSAPATSKGLLNLVRGQSDDVDLLAGSRWVPPKLEPRLSTLPTPQEVHAAQGSMVQPVLDVPADRQWALVDNVCAGLDVYDALTGTPEDVVTFALSRDDSLRSYYVQAYDLADNLMSVESAGSAAEILARAGLCQAASVYAT